jgi:hypothetical protein
LAALPALGQGSTRSWALEKDNVRGIDISARQEIQSPHGAGFARFRITYQPGVNPPVIVYLIIESPKQLPLFPFDKYDGPIDKTKNEFITLELAPSEGGTTQTIKWAAPNGSYAVTPPDAFVFDTVDKSVVSFLLKAGDEQKLRVTVNGVPRSIQVAFDTSGLKTLFHHVGLTAGAPGTGAVSSPKR